MQTAIVLVAGLLLYSANKRRLAQQKQLPIAPKLDLILSSHRLALPSLAGWHASNVSCFTARDQRWLLVRYVNYKLYETMKREQHGPGRTLNVLVKLKPNSLTHYEDYFPIEIATDLKEHANRISYGIEDIRVLSGASSRLLCVGATVGYGTHPTKSDAILAYLDLEAKLLDNVRLCLSPDSSKQQKNWIPVQQGNKTLLVQYLEPLQTALVREDLSIEQRPRKSPVPWSPSPLCGSSNYLELNALHAAILDFAQARYLCVVHRTLVANRRKSYQHAFCLFDEDLNILKRGDWFSFESNKVEFCMGLCFSDRTKTTLALYYTVLDADPKVALVLLSKPLLNRAHQ